LFAAKSGQLDILGITTVCGNVPLKQVTLNTNRLLKFMELDGKINVYEGASCPLLKEAYHEFRVHGDDGIGGALNHIDADEMNNEVFAPDFIIEQAKK